MLDDIKSAVIRVITECELDYDTKHEAFNDPNTLATIIASEVLKAITIQTPHQPKQQRAPRKKKDAESTPPPADGGSIAKSFPVGELA